MDKDNKARKTKILAIPDGIIFLRRDVALLEKHFNVKMAPFELRKIKRKPFTGFLSVLADIIGIIIGTFWADLTFSWFADIHAFLAVIFSKILGKKSVVIIGGYEVARMSEIQYGAMLNPVLSRLVLFVLKFADELIAVSEYNRLEILKYVNREDISHISNAVDCLKYKPSDEKENLVITVSFINKIRIKLKGLDTFIKAAKHLPQLKFVVIGQCLDYSINELKIDSPPNVEFMDDTDLIKHYKKAKVYCQLSYHESFGLALAEAMACECVPVVTERAALPEVVGDTGFYVPFGDVPATVEAIQKALESDRGKEARERIKNYYPIEKREKELVKEIEGLLK